MPATEHVVVADIRVPSWVDGNSYRVAIRRNYRGLRRGVPRTPVVGAGMRGTRGQPQTGPTQTARQQQSGCQPHDDWASAALPITGNTRCLQHWLHLGPVVPDECMLAPATCGVLASRLSYRSQQRNSPTPIAPAREGGPRLLVDGRRLATVRTPAAVCPRVRGLRPNRRLRRTFQRGSAGPRARAARRCGRAEVSGRSLRPSDPSGSR